jgi:hypothetical protein
MTKRERLRYDMFIRIVQFIKDNIADFPAGVVAAQLAVLTAIIDRLQVLLGEQSAGLSEARFGFSSKGTARENLRLILVEIAETARSMVYEFPGIELKFRMFYNNNDADMLGKARAFLTEATPLEANFVHYGMDEDFLTELQEAIDDFEGSLGTPATAIDSHVEATEEIGEEIRKGMIALRTVNGPIKNKYRNDAGKLAAWLSASHIENIAKKKKRGNETPPTA